MSVAFGIDEPSGPRLASPSFRIVGWLLQPETVELRGIRAVVGDAVFKARRKQIRTDVFLAHPDHPDSLRSGFVIDLEVGIGRKEARLQFKDQTGKWNEFHTLPLHLSAFWRLARLLRKEPRKLTEYETWFARYGALSEADRDAIRTKIDTLQHRPLISVVMPAFNTPPDLLRKAIDSVRRQLYPRWELCIADDYSTARETIEILRQCAREDQRIKIAWRQTNGHISEASNSALEEATGEFMALLDHDDELTEDALYHVAAAIAARPDVDMIYSDEDKLDEAGRLCDPAFKGEWSPDLMLGQNAVCHLAVLRASLVRAVGGFRKGFEGCQDWDLFLRVSERTDASRILHIPRVLYHWRRLTGSTAASIDHKSYAQDAAKRALEEALSRRSLKGEVSPASRLHWRVKWPVPDPPPKVSIIIPTRDRLDLLERCIETLRHNTNYTDYEIIIVNHESSEPATLRYFDTLRSDPRIVIFDIHGAFNWSRFSNKAVKIAAGSIFLFLNNDIEVIDPGWLTELVAQCARPDVAVAGAKLLYPYGAIQHAGVVVGMAGVAGHIYRGCPEDYPGATLPSNLVRDVTAVTGACLAVRRDVFDRLGGFDEAELGVGYSDIDFCARGRAAGLRVVYTPFCRLLHHESASRKEQEQRSARKDAATNEALAFARRWPDLIASDPFYSPNLTLDEIPRPGPPRSVKG